MSHRIERTGKRFGRLTVVGFAGTDARQVAHWKEETILNEV